MPRTATPLAAPASSLGDVPPESREYWITSTPHQRRLADEYFDYGQQGEPDFWSLRWRLS